MFAFNFNWRPCSEGWKLFGPRFVRNVNLNYLRDPLSLKGTFMWPCETSYTGFYRLAESGRVYKVEYLKDQNSVKYYLTDTDEIFFCNMPYDPTLYKAGSTRQPQFEVEGAATCDERRLSAATRTGALCPA